MQNSAFEINHFRQNRSLRLGSKLFQLDRPLIMGILNITPDSFYTESRIIDKSSALSKAKSMIMDGADILDIGGYSTRPGADDISVEEEISRTIPVIEAIRDAFPEILISIDTFRSEVAEEAILVGANMINDISGFESDKNIVQVAAKHHVPYILMHMKGTPKTMQQNTHYENIYTEMCLYFSEKINYLRSEGVHDIILDPGFGFSKTLEQNYHLLHHLEAFHLFDLPLLVGISRKSMIYKKLGVSPEESLPGTIALNAISLEKGASILRVHDVKEGVQLVKLLGD